MQQCLERILTERSSVPFCGGVDGDGHSFWDCQFPPLVRVREDPECASLFACNRSKLPWCLAWHVWLPMLHSRGVDLPWAVDIADSVDASLESELVSSSPS